MAQAPWIPLDATVDDGVTLSDKLNQSMPAIYSNHAGNAIPLNPQRGQFWVDTAGLPVLEVKQYDGAVWRSLWTVNADTGALGGPFAGGGGGGGASVTISDIPPATPSVGDLWFDSVRLNTFVFYEDANSSQWVQIVPTFPPNIVPPGTIIFNAGDTELAGYLRADGAAHSRVTYAALFAQIGITYGPGDGIATFNVPDLRGEFLRGLDKGRGIDVNRVLGDLQLDALQTHVHQVSGPTTSGTAITGTGSGWNFVQFNTGNPIGTGVRTATETRPRNLAMPAFIKF